MRSRNVPVRLFFAAMVPFVLASCVMVEGARVKALPVQLVAEARQAVAAPARPGFSPSFIQAPAGVALAMAPADRLRATVCLASAVYYEAAHEPEAGQRAVAQVVLNRMRHPDWPNTVCGVVYEGSARPGCQFSFACDGAEARRFNPEIWARSRKVAEDALAGASYAPVGDATFYHTHAVAPAWRLRLQRVAVIGAHIFYRLPGGARLSDVYRGGEAVPTLRQFTPAPAALPVSAPPPPQVPDIHIMPITRGAKPNLPTSPIVMPADGDIRPEWANSGQVIEGR